MLSQFVSCLLFMLSSAMSKSAVNADDQFCSRDHRQEVFLKDEFRYLNVTRLGTYTVHNIFHCTFECLSNPSCQSLNLAASKREDGKLWCELLSSTKYSNPEVYKENASSHHFSIKIPRLSTPCQNGGTCVRNRRNYSYECKCKGDFVGKHCERKSAPGSSCKDIYDRNSPKENKAYENVGSQRISVYCHMNGTGLGACGGGGWTLVMKIDGTKKNFHYDSNLWSNNETFNVAAGATGFDTQETKLPTYWNTSFSKICLGMKVGQQINFIVVHKEASSLYSLIADGQFRNTSLGRNTWKTLIGSEASLQRNCNKEGFNALNEKRVHSKARIGILGNNEDDCATGDSRIGFGCGGHPFASITCGNAACAQSDNGDRDITAMGYILVQ